MVLTTPATTNANEASKVFRQQIRSVATLNGLQATEEQGNHPIRLPGVCKPWAPYSEAFQGAEVGVPIMFSGWGYDRFKHGIGIQPILQTDRGNGYQNVFFRTAFLASSVPFPIAIVCEGGAFSGANEPAYFYRWMKRELLASKNVAFVGTLAEFRGFMVSEVGVIDLQSEAA